jgi:hypothetical protein
MSGDAQGGSEGQFRDLQAGATDAKQTIPYVDFYQDEWCRE